MDGGLAEGEVVDGGRWEVEVVDGGRWEAEVVDSGLGESVDGSSSGGRGVVGVCGDAIGTTCSESVDSLFRVATWVLTAGGVTEGSSVSARVCVCACARACVCACTCKYIQTLGRWFSKTATTTHAQVPHIAVGD